MSHTCKYLQEGFVNTWLSMNSFVSVTPWEPRRLIQIYFTRVYMWSVRPVRLIMDGHEDITIYFCLVSGNGRAEKDTPRFGRQRMTFL